MLLASACGAGGVQAQSPASDAVAKANFTVTLTRFVQWPAATPGLAIAPLRLCVLHRSPALGAAFASHAGETIAGRVLLVHSNPGPMPGDCHVVFVDASADRQTAEALARSAAPALVIGALDGFLERGGMVELVNVNDALRFDVSLPALRTANLGLSSQVLKLARQVRE